MKNFTADCLTILKNEQNGILRQLLGEKDPIKTPCVPYHSRLQRKLRRIDAAISRIDEGQFGYCEQCNQWIGNDRLRLLPFVERCQGCQRNLEQYRHSIGR